MAGDTDTLGSDTLGGLGSFGGTSSAKRWMTPGSCGCCSCTYFLDKFTRADNSDLGSDWTESAGSWEIDTYRLVTTSATGLCLCNELNDHDEHVVSAHLRGMAVGDQARLVSSKITTEDSYWFAEVTWQATTATIELYQRTTGSNTQRGSTTTLYNMAPGIPLHVRIAFDATTICVHYRRDTGDIWTEATSYSALVTDSQCGVGTGTVNGEVRVDDFRLEQHGTLYPRCPKCTRECSGCEGSMPDEFLIVPDGPIGDLPPVAKILLPTSGYVVRRMEGNPCFYYYDFPTAVVLPSGAKSNRVFLSFFNYEGADTTRVWVGFFQMKPPPANPPLYYALWQKYISPAPTCSAFSAETDFRWMPPSSLTTGGFPHIDWEVTGL